MKFKKAVLVNIADTHFTKEYWDKIDQLVENRISLKRDDPQLMTELQDCDVLLLGFQVPISRDVFDAAPNLKLVNILATAYGTVDLEEATKRDIPVCNLGGYSTESVAEFTIAAILHEMRDMEEGRTRAKAGNYDTSGIRARELKGSNFGVIGLGSIGNRVAELAAGFGANVSYWSRNKRENTPFKYTELPELLNTSTYISVNVAETEETIGLLNSTNLPLIKSDSVVISTVPPSVIETAALADRLAKGDITFITDHPSTTKPEDLELLKAFDNCILYPGIAYLSDEATIAKQETFVGNLASFLAGNPQHQVN